jgi:hypothetical protein
MITYTDDDGEVFVQPGIFLDVHVKFDDAWLAD